MNMPASPGNVRPPAIPPASRQPAPARRTTRRRTLVLSGAVALVLAALALVRFASAPAEEAAAVDQPDRLERASEAQPNAEPAPVAPALEATQVSSAGIVAAPVVTEQPPGPAVHPKPRKLATVKPAKKPVAAATKSSAPIANTPVANVPAREAAAASPERGPSVSTQNFGTGSVTLTGCLEMSVNRDEFRLSDTDGVDAPRSRNWRTAFLTKRPMPVALVEAPDPYGLQIQVGKRVAATGVLTDRELKVSSVRVVASTCD
jgi:hypothetical protein